jgi:hypothetical protein
VSELSTRVGEGNTNLSARISSLDARVTDTNNHLTNKLEDNVTLIDRTHPGGHKQYADQAGQRFRAASHPDEGRRRLAD